MPVMKIAPLILSLLILSPGQGKSPGVHVLCYHSFNTDKNKFSFLLHELKSQLEFFKKRGFRFVTFSDIKSGSIRGNRNILITVDDGNRSVYDAYFNVFRPMKIKPVLAIYPAITGRKKYALTWEQLKRLSDEGCEVAAHGYSHRHLNSRLYRKEPRVFKREIFTSKKLLERRLGRSVDIFVFPYGVKSPEAVKALRAAGYSYAFTINSGMMSFSSARGDLVYNLPRYMITRGTRSLYLNRIARNTDRKKQVIAVNRPEKKPGSNPDIQPLVLKPKKQPKPVVEMIGAAVVYRDRYRDYSRKEGSSLINLNLKDSLAEVEEKSRISPVDNYTTHGGRKSSGETRAAVGFGIADIPGYSSTYASNSNSMKASLGNRGREKGESDSFLGKLKSSWRKTAVSTYSYYSLWAERLRTKMYAVRKKIEKLLDKIFT
jgi:peptidoglycan/xylan/chitin deacetylase (PgdA/CDA1 family)